MSATGLSATEAGSRRRLGLLAGLGPKHLVSLLITLILVVGEWRYHILGGYARLALTLGTCVATEAVLSLLLARRFPFLQSAYISGISLTMLLRPAGGVIWPFFVGAMLAIGSKYVLRRNGRHLWNPSNFALGVFLLAAPSQVAILSHEFGNDLGTNLVIWAVGLLVASRARILHVTVTYVACFLALAAVRSALVGSPLFAEMAPITGPMYQLFIFFMITDPRTTVSTRRGRILVAGVIALVEAVIRYGNDLSAAWAAPLAYSPAILALFLVGPVAMWIDLGRGSRANAAA